MDCIKDLPHRTAHTVLLALCNDPSILKRAVEFSELLQPLQQEAAPPPKKRKKSSSLGSPELPVQCRRCEKFFMRGKNAPTSCVYHEGILEPDYDGFWDHCDLYDCEYEVESEEMQRDYPEAYFWDCCGKKGDEDSGCKTGYHVEPELARSRKQNPVLREPPRAAQGSEYFSDSGQEHRAEDSSTVRAGQASSSAREVIDLDSDHEHDDNQGRVSTIPGQLVERASSERTSRGYSLDAT